ncbi:3'-5' exonuclease [Butyrivibrio sp. NC2002]|uniref:3'-5' exonuclease n=1 Tax=Butyrivibrio sp. NC2002 TaxID=1410610 RepID=UPI00056B1796|nr:3'-5' exonuclease [Butyrivibrio sp. NC2002]
MNDRPIEITKEQEECVDYHDNEVMIVNGVAGTGKSIVLLYRALNYIKENENNKYKRVIIITYNKSLVKATKQKLLEKGDKRGYITVTTPNAFFEKICLALNLDRNRICDEMTKLNYVRDALCECIEEVGISRLNSLSADFWDKEIRWMKESNITTNDKVKYLELKRPGRGTDIEFTEEEKHEAFYIFCKYMSILRNQKMVDWEDLPLFIVRNPERIPDSFKFDHVLIDEAQDLSLAQMLASMKIYKKDIVIASDFNQRLYLKQWSIDELGIKTDIKVLHSLMRTTKQIGIFAESFRKKNEDCIAEKEDMSNLGSNSNKVDLPVIAMLNSAKEEKEYVIREVKAWLSESSNITIGILASKTSQLDIYASWMTDAGIPKEIIRRDGDFDITTPGVKIVTTHSAKGMEFSRVIIPQFNEGNFPYGYQPKLDEEKIKFLERERNRTYVAITRARLNLTITCTKSKKSRFIDEIDSDYYVLKDMTKLDE